MIDTRSGVYAFLLAAFLGMGCRDRAGSDAKVVPSPTQTKSASPHPVMTPRKQLRGGMNVTFVVVSDTHFGYLYPEDLSKLSKSAAAEPVGLEKDSAKLIAHVNAIAGRPYPSTIGGLVEPPRGLVVTGDLTEWGQPHEWARFVEMFGLRGTEGLLKLPVFEMIGNHDKVAKGPWVAEQVAARHGGRFYSWDWDDLHLIALGEAPDDEGLEFLARDLESVSLTVPLVVFFHLAIEGPWSTDNWFDQGYKQRLGNVLSGRNVAGIFHGHHHATGHYVWRGIDVWKPGAVKNDAHTFAVVHVTDAKWTLASYDWESDTWGSTYVKGFRR